MNSDVTAGPSFVALLMARLQLEQRFAVASLAAGARVRPLQSQVRHTGVIHLF